jgi:hypothetical protein
MYSTTTVLSGGTVLISSKPGAALYLGDYLLKAKYGENLMLVPTERSFEAAQAELDTFSGVHVKLVDEEAEIRSFKCAEGRLERRECDPVQIVMAP